MCTMQKCVLGRECVAGGAFYRARDASSSSSALRGQQRGRNALQWWKCPERSGLGSWGSGALGLNIRRRYHGCCVASAWNSGSARNEEAKQETVGEECLKGDATKDGSISGLMVAPLRTVGKSSNIVWHGCMVTKQERQRMLNQKGCVIWITGLSGSGKSTLACALDHALLQAGKLSYVLDGDNVRHGLNANLGFTPVDRAENIRRVAEVAKLFADTGVICIASFISPYQRDRDACRHLLPPGHFIEVFMDVALEVCEHRDPKGLYKLACAGKIKGFTGVDDPYEAPPHAELVMAAVDGAYASPQDMALQMMSFLDNRGFLRGDDDD